jgi:phosphoglycerate dehydrogenase-like enzyme
MTVFLSTIWRRRTPQELGLDRPGESARMKSRAILIDAVCEPVVYSDALDETDPEPLPTNHQLVGLPNCLIAPYGASARIATHNKMVVITNENLLAGLEGNRLPHYVNPEVYLRLSDIRSGKRHLQ